MIINFLKTYIEASPGTGIIKLAYLFKIFYGFVLQKTTTVPRVTLKTKWKRQASKKIMFCDLEGKVHIVMFTKRMAVLTGSQRRVHDYIKYNTDSIVYIDEWLQK